MEYISSDTNVWIDFAVIKRLELPFQLPYIYLMNQDAADDELLNPPGLGEELERLGLHKIELTEDEFYLAEGYADKYLRLSLYDRIALAIAKCRNIILFTGDRRLRKAAHTEGVVVIGTIGILDQLLDGNYIDLEEYHGCISRLIENNGGKIRLPMDELKKRL